MQPVLQRNSQFIPLLLQEEKKLNSKDFLAEARKPNSPTSQLLDRAWKEIPELTHGHEVVSALKTCETLAKRILKATPETLNESFKFTFQDGTSLDIKRSQLQPLLADSPVLKVMLEGSFSEGNKKEATLGSISKEIFEILLKYTHSDNDKLLTSHVLLDVLEAGYFLLNPFIIQGCINKLYISLKEKNWDSVIDPERLINLTVNKANMLNTAIFVPQFLFRILGVSLNEGYERLKNSTPSIFNFYISSFESMLQKWNSLVKAIQIIETPRVLKEKLNEIILRKVKQLHFDYDCQLLGTVENTIKILKGLLDAGYPKEEVYLLIREYTDDLRHYHDDKKELMKVWLEAIQTEIPVQF